MGEFGQQNLTRILEELRQGHRVEDNFRELHLLLSRRVYGYFRAKGFPPEDAADLTQDVFIRVYKGLAGFRGEAGFATWVLQIAANARANWVRDRKAAKRNAAEEPLPLDDALARDGSRPSGPSLPASPRGDDPEQRLLHEERREVLRAAADRLPPQMRACLTLRIHQERSYDEIATVMKISIDAVKSHLHQARDRLKRELVDHFEVREL